MLVTLQAILFATMGFVIGGFLSKDVFDLRAGLPQMAIITPVMVFVTLICIAGMLTALACHRALGQAATVNEEIGELWKDERQKIFDFEQSQLRGPRMTYDDAMAMFPNPRGGRGDAMDRHASVLRTRFIPLLFVVIWGITLLMVLGGLEWILIADPTPPGSGSAGG